MRSNGKLAAFSWSLYDFADTIYSMNVVSLYFPLWLTIDKGMPDILYSSVYSTAIILAALLSPWLGALSDKWRTRKKLLATTTSLCILFAGTLSFVPNVPSALGCFLVAHLFYVLSLVLYNALLPDVSGRWGLGRISGLGVGVGYAGTIVGLLVANRFHGGPWGRQGTFLPTAILFLIFALPLFIWVKESQEKRREESLQVFSWRRLLQWKNHSAAMRRFLLANFLCGDAVHTVILFMSVYCNKVFHLSDDQLTAFYILSTLVAIAGSFIWGELNQRWGALRVFRTVLVLWCLTLLLAVFDSHPWIYWPVGSLVGLALAGTWVSSRVLLVELAPPERVGEYFGLYNLTGKSAAVVGPLVWGALLLLFSSAGEIKYRIALFALLFFLLGSLWALQKMKIKE